MRYLTLAEVVDLHRLITRATGGASGIRDLGALETAIAQPRATFDMNELYPSVVDKAAVLCFSIVQGHPFVDGNKRAGHAAMSSFLLLNGAEIDATLDEQEQIMLFLASGQMNRQQFTDWLSKHVKTAPDSQGVIAVGRPVARTAPAQIPACRFLAPGSSEILASASGPGKEKPAL